MHALHNSKKIGSNFLEISFLRDSWTKIESDILYWYYVQSKNCTDIVGNIVQLLKDSQYNPKSRLSVIQQLLHEVSAYIYL